MTKDAGDLLVTCPKCDRSMDICLCGDHAYCGFCNHEETLKSPVQELDRAPGHGAQEGGYKID